MNPNQHWILDKKGEKPIPVDLMTWAKWFEGRDRILKQEQVGNYWISTVFLGLDHNFNSGGEPILWETMVFRRKKGEKRQFGDLDCDRCSGNREQAEAMHQKMVSKWEIEV